MLIEGAEVPGVALEYEKHFMRSIDNKINLLAGQKPFIKKPKTVWREK